MYGSGSSKEQVMEMLLEENANEKDIPKLADTFYLYHLQLQKLNHNRQLKAADIEMMGGGVALAAGLLLTLFSYLTIHGNHYVLFPGVMIAGLAFLLKGIIAKNNLKRKV